MDDCHQPTERAVEKCQRLKSWVQYKPRNFDYCKRKSLKSCAGQPVVSNSTEYDIKCLLGRV